MRRGGPSSIEPRRGCSMRRTSRGRFECARIPTRVFSDCVAAVRLRTLQERLGPGGPPWLPEDGDRKSTRLNSSHRCISYAVFCLKKKRKKKKNIDYNK